MPRQNGASNRPIDRQGDVTTLANPPPPQPGSEVIMIEITKGTELAVRTPIAPTELGNLLATVAAACVETLASCLYHERDCAVMLLVTDDPLRTTAELRVAGFRVSVSDVVLVHAPYEPRLAMQLSRQLSAAAIGVLYSYVSWTEAHRAYLVFRTTDNDRAVRLLREEMLVHKVVPASTIPAEGSTLEHAAA